MNYKKAKLVVLLSDSKSDNNIINMLELLNVEYITVSSYMEIEHIINDNYINLLLSFKAYDCSLKHFKNIYSRLSSMFIYESGTIVINNENEFEINICNTHKHICREFSGLSFNSLEKNIKYIDSVTDNIDVLISAMGNFPVFLLKHNNKCEIFMLSSEIQDINYKVIMNFDIREYYLGIVPIIMYLKYVINNFSGKFRKFANIIIDDPLLHIKYGFLNFNELIDAMSKYKFCSTIAFIPWNYNRTNHHVANLLRYNKNNIGLCVHGCDHTKGEYSNTDIFHLNKLTKLATSRMIEHEIKTGLSFTKIMVFPQGKFSNQAMQSLKENNYIAAINTNPISTNLIQKFELREFLRPYIKKYYDLPLFTRRHPEDILGISFDLFFGKPIFIVIHHNYLKGGCKKLIESVNNINMLSENIHWSGLEDILCTFLGTDNIKYNMELANVNADNIYSKFGYASVCIRRHASEFRDNYLSKNDLVLGIANSIKNLFKF